MPIVNQNILRWARETAGLTPPEAVKKLAIRDTKTMNAVDRLGELEAGTRPPTRPMLVKMSKQYRRPLLTFYLSEIPRKGDRGQDFRTLPEGHDPASNALLDVLIRDVRARQSMVRAVLEDEEEAEPHAFIGSMTMDDGIRAVLGSIRQTIPMDIAEFRAQVTAEDAFKLLRSRVENIGIYVLLIGNLGSYHTAIDLETFRGFAVADEVAPFVIMNDQDAKAAWAFTLMHEITHLWLGQTGVSGVSVEVAVERFCNDVAGEYLLPAAELAQLDLPDPRDTDSLMATITEFANDRNVSRSMVAYKLYRQGFLEFAIWRRVSEAFRKEWVEGREDRRRRAREQDGGPSYYVVRQHRVGSALIELVRRMLGAGALTTTKAGKVLGVKPKNVQSLIETANTTRAA